MTRDNLKCSPVELNKVWIVTGETGEYADRSEWIAAAFTNERVAEKFKEACQLEADKEDSRHLDFKHSLDPKFKCSYTGTTYDIEKLDLFDEFITE
jgi:hypothetical protein